MSSVRWIAPCGEGATAVVWRGEGPDGTPLALKLGRTRRHATVLAREALAASLAPSPRLNELVGVGVGGLDGDRWVPDAAGRPGAAFRWVEGVPLSEAPRSEPEPLAVDLADALAALHEAGLGHGDVKPANVRIGPGGATLVDLGMVGAATATAIGAATPRYLGRGDRELGDGRARDLLALGILLAELADEAVARSEDPLATARSAAIADPLGAVIAALLAPAPWARPDARWVRAALSGRRDVATEGWGRRVRASYLRLRSGVLARAAGVEDGVAPWASEAAAVVDRLRAVCDDCGAPPPAGIAEPGARVGPMDLEGRRRWLVSLVGETAAGWPAAVLERPSEPALAEALSQLATAVPPASWSLADVERALADEATTAPGEPELDAEGLTRLTLALRRTPPDETALLAVERRRAEVPTALRLAAADVLRLRGELGRARSLVRGVERGGAVAADVLRRAGDLARAEAVAARTVEDEADPDGRALGVLARLALDGGDPEHAATLTGERPSRAPVCEVAALAAMSRGEPEAAQRLADRTEALADHPEARARAAALRAYVTGWRDPRAAAEGFGEAVTHAVRAGAVLEEAQYRTGEATACVDLGQLARAVESARRAALLYDEVLRKPAVAANAWQACAAAHAAVDDAAGATRAAEEAIARASLSGDDRVALYAWWSIADAHEAGSEEGRRAAERASELAEHAVGDDATQSAARSHRHGLEADVEALDTRCRGSGETTSYARLAWWHARAERQLIDGPDEEGPHVLAELCALAETRAPVSTLGKAMDAAARLAATLGDTDALARAEAARRTAASAVIAATRGTDLAEAAGACAWLRRRDAAQAMPTEQAIDLQQLVRALSERDSLDSLLDRVVDVLLMWTGAERGLLLLLDAHGELEPRSARNLGKSDLDGDQLVLSTSLAKRALDRGEPVVAIDAMEELSRAHRSVHALKLRSVLALPLATRGELLGVAYLDDRVRRGAFGTKELTWAQAIAPVAALAIADARRQAELSEAVARAERMQSRLEETLAKKETELDVAARELARAKPARRPFGDVVGGSEEMSRVLSLVERIAPSNVPVLLQGESGSGKEVIAHAIHRASNRAEEPFVGENCGALPETLLESALFGHVKGAFTGADRPRVGLFEAADGGTLFLDEVGEMSINMQTKLLRVLEDRQVRPVGATRMLRVDVRIICATNQDLEKMVAANTFREDLYYRLNVIALEVPPLRARPSDVAPLVDHFVKKHGGDRSIRITPAARRRLEGYGWPGNVRQLENEIRRALLLADDTIDVEHLTIPENGESSAGQRAGLDLKARIDHLETELVSEAMARTGGNQTQAAKMLGISRYGLHKMMKRLGLKT